MIILGIETSCDETAAAVVQNGDRILSSVVASQIDVHHLYGGVVPEIASRKHIEAITPVVSQAIHESGHSLQEVDGIAVTQGPGLVGALLVGFSFGRALAMSLHLPWIGINHLEGHIHSLFLENQKPEFPFVALLASGGHTSIYHVAGPTDFELMGRTLDDAAGEAFDKVAKLLGLGYPGGKIIEDQATMGNADAIHFPRTFLDKSDFNFSFSGLKSAVRRYVQIHESDYRDHIPDIAASFQEAACEVMCHKLIHAAQVKNCTRIGVAGGVAANSRLRQTIQDAAFQKNFSVHIPSLELCGDNAAMIASAGYHYLAAGNRSDLDDDVFSKSPIH
ncbi:MAG: tRNA (adenosine(37)-N6)-threonylcarbamoyltransferase complex transferase subunit TsaD [Desulfatirhabdiaceae bacterium]